jgi:hypothetical protein
MALRTSRWRATTARWAKTVKAQGHYEQALQVFRNYRTVTYPFNLAGRGVGAV